MRYELTKLRIINLWLAPIILIAIIALILTNAILNNKSLFIIVGIVIIIIVFIGPFTFLFLNHFRFASATKLDFKGDKLEITQSDRSFQIDLKEVTYITEYSINNKYAPGKLPWSDIIEWKVTTNTLEFYISSLTISKSDFKKHFKNEINYHFTYFPVITRIS